MASRTSQPRQLTDVNALLDSLSLGRTTTVDWQGPNGFREDGVLVYRQGDVYFFGTAPWTARDFQVWRAQSPISHARDVKAPPLITGDVGDPSVPLINS